MKSESNERIGIFGGTFNPVHLGHINSALTVTRKLKLDKLFIVPAHENPLKVFVEGFHWFATPSKMLTTVIVAVYSYFTQQYFSFKVKSAGKGEMRAS